MRGVAFDVMIIGVCKVFTKLCVELIKLVDEGRVRHLYILSFKGLNL